MASIHPVDRISAHRILCDVTVLVRFVAARLPVHHVHSALKQDIAAFFPVPFLVYLGRPPPHNDCRGIISPKATGKAVRCVGKRHRSSAVEIRRQLKNCNVVNKVIIVVIGVDPRFRNIPGLDILIVIPRVVQSNGCCPCGPQVKVCWVMTVCCSEHPTWCNQ